MPSPLLRPGRMSWPVGPWEFRSSDTGAWRPIAVPGCWEAHGVPKTFAGPVSYRACLQVPSDLGGRRLWLRFGAASYHAEVELNGEPLGGHTGLWDAFSFEITGRVEAGASTELVVRLEKPASLTGGPDSPSFPGHFALRETLTGFLPYVWGHIFGGLWQEVWLEAGGPIALEDVYVRGGPDGSVTLEAVTSPTAPLHFEVRDPVGRAVLHRRVEPAERVRLTAALPDPRPWSPHDPALYTALVEVEGDARELRFGLRELRADGATLRLNGAPIYPRLALSWGWYPHSLHANPGPEAVRRDFERLRQLGYNGVKLCLWFPPAYYFDLADELGMLLWVELPMWLPKLSDFFREQTPPEIERLVRQARQHPSVVLYSLGCELNAEAGADFLGPLYRRVKALIPDALLRDNSGSGEAYGGLLAEFADYYDHHFYAELPHFRALLDHFTPRWRPEQPWLFGEFCDADSFRDLRRLEPRPWWASSDPAENPQGARWQYDLPEQEARLRANGHWSRGAQLEHVSGRQAQLHRKHTLETVRLYREVSGYVVTGEADTPISTAGMWDDSGQLKFAPEDFAAFNADTVALIGWDRRRAWVAGGDHVAHWDHHSALAGETVRAHAVISHYGPRAGDARLNWSARFVGEAPFAGGTLERAGGLEPGELARIGVAEFQLPKVSAPRALELRFEARLGAQVARNAWPLWVFPREAWREVAPFALLDPAGTLTGLERLGARLVLLEAAEVAVACQWSAELDAWVRRGGRAALLNPPGGPLRSSALPFWREAIKLIEPHPAWGDFPHDGWCDLQFYGMSAEAALETVGLPVRPILRRLDARTMAVHDYAGELPWGAGRLIVTTLNFAGGHGDQPSGLARNVAAAHLLRNFVQALQGKA